MTYVVVKIAEKTEEGDLDDKTTQLDCKVCKVGPFVEVTGNTCFLGIEQ